MATSFAIRIDRALVALFAAVACVGCGLSVTPSATPTSAALVIAMGNALVSVADGTGGVIGGINSTLASDEVLRVLGDTSATTEARGTQVLVVWLSQPCQHRHLVTLSGNEDGITIDIHNGPWDPGTTICPTSAEARAIVLSFNRQPTIVDVRHHRGP